MYAKAYDIGLGKKPINSILMEKEKPMYEEEPGYIQHNYVQQVTPKPPKPPIQQVPIQQVQIVDNKLPEKGDSNPNVWGPHYWYNLHNSSAIYPINANPLVRNVMKSRILAIPYELPCRKCQIHASAYIQQFSDIELDNIVSTREKLFNFYVDFHNAVNARLGKPIWTYEQAYNHYSRKA